MRVDAITVHAPLASWPYPANFSQNIGIRQAAFFHCVEELKRMLADFADTKMFRQGSSIQASVGLSPEGKICLVAVVIIGGYLTVFARLMWLSLACESISTPRFNRMVDG